MDVQETPLPGIGLRYDFVTAAGQRVGVVVHRSGRYDLVLYAEDDPDACQGVVALKPAEVEVLAEIMGAPRIVERLEHLDHIEGLVTDQVSIGPGSRYDGRTLGDTQARSRTGASVVAVIRGADVIASPRPDFAFGADDVVVVVGTPEGIAGVREILGA
jgi:TrkA domain protein